MELIGMYMQCLGRLLVKADSALVKIPELSFEIPPNTQRGVVTTVEGLLSRAISGLLKEQTNRKVSGVFCCDCHSVHAHEGYGSLFTCLSVCTSVPTLVPTYDVLATN